MVAGTVHLACEGIFFAQISPCLPGLLLLRIPITCHLVEVYGLSRFLFNDIRHGALCARGTNTLSTKKVIDLPQSGRHKEAPRRGADTQESPDRAYFELFIIEVKLGLLFITVFLLANILAHSGFVVPDRTDTIASGPKMEASHPFLVQHVTVDLDRAFPFQESHCIRNTVPGRNTQTQMNMVRHRMAFEEFHSQLVTQLPKYWPDLLTHLAIEDFLPVLRNEYDMELAVPFDM
jgi:hypothetical protein